MNNREVVVWRQRAVYESIRYSSHFGFKIFGMNTLTEVKKKKGED